uniref:C-type lectin domain-containing protein n=1 Tax=Caenorhabditis japonica TaxID=281687 RepID=A0A8R1DKH8_CAEJA
MRSDALAFWLLLPLFYTISNALNNSCAGTILLNATTDLQYLTTPNYESNYKYPPFLDCRFVIKAPDKTRISIHIIDIEMEPRIFDECVDYVGIAPDDNCVKVVVNEKLDWISAQNRCLEQQSNLVMVDSSQKTSEMEDFYKNVPNKLWVGYTDSATEGRLVSIDNKDASIIPGRDPSTSLTDNNDNNDCMTLQFGDNQPYRMDSCASYNGFICEMKKDGTTVLYEPPIQDIQDGSFSRSSQYTLWILLFLIGLLFLTILAFLCFMCWKQKDARVHTESTTIQQNAFMSDSSVRAEQPAVPLTEGQINAVAPLPSNPNEIHNKRDARTAISMENNRQAPKRFPTAPGPNRLPMAEDHIEEDPIGETLIMREADGDEVSAAPKPHPRTLPPMPLREGTFQSIKTTFVN